MIFRNLIIIGMICIFVSPIFIIQYLNNIGINKALISLFILLFVIIVLNSAYGDFISSRIELQMQLFKDKVHSTKQRINVMNLM
jgi:hypothetical protein